MIPVCATCGAVFPAGDAAPATCPICEDERAKWVPEDGQRWSSLDALAAAHRNELREEEPGLLGVGIEPSSPSASGR